MLRKFRRKGAIIVLAAVASLVVAGAAIAYFSSTGGGSGTGSVGSVTTADITVAQTSAVSGLLPGGPSAPLSGTLTNGGAGNEYVSGVTAQVTGVTSGTGAGEVCTPGMFSVTGTSTPGENVAAHSSTLVGGGAATWSGLSVQLNDDGHNQDNCQNATLTITYKSN